MVFVCEHLPLHETSDTICFNSLRFEFNSILKIKNTKMLPNEPSRGEEGVTQREKQWEKIGGKLRSGDSHTSWQDLSRIQPHKWYWNNSYDQIPIYDERDCLSPFKHTHLLQSLTYDSSDITHSGYSVAYSLTLSRSHSHTLLEASVSALCGAVNVPYVCFVQTKWWFNEPSQYTSYIYLSYSRIFMEN